MTIGRAVFLRPVEITSSSDSVTFNATAKTLTNGTESNMLVLLYKLQVAMRTVSGMSAATVSIGANPALSTYGKVTLANATAFTVTWTDEALRDAIGFDSNLSSGTSHTATNRINYAWFSDYTPSDRNTWALDHRSTFAGGMSRSGELVGMATGPAIYKRTLTFDAETGANVFRAQNQDGYPGWYRCLESFIEGARSSAPTVSTHAPTHGFWFMYSGTSLSVRSSMVFTSGYYMEGDYEAVFCHLNPEGMRTPSASLGVKRDWYQVSLDIHTATTPTWDN
jgi:hypothetical protein